MNAIKIKTKLTTDDMFRFNMYDAYHGTRGWSVIALALIVFIIAGLTFGRVSLAYTIAYYILGIFFIVYMPFTLKKSSALAMKTNPILSEPIDYTFDEKGVTLHTEADLGGAPQTDSFEWNIVYKVIKTKQHLLIYMNSKNAHILPLRDLGDSQEALEKLIKDQVEGYKVKL